MFERALDGIGPLIGGHTQNVMFVVVGDQQFQVSRVLEVARLLDAADLGQDLWVHSS